MPQDEVIAPAVLGLPVLVRVGLSDLPRERHLPSWSGWQRFLYLAKGEAAGGLTPLLGPPRV